MAAEPALAPRATPAIGWPVAGCRADGISTLRSVRLTDPDERGISYAYGGSICTTLVVLREGPPEAQGRSPSRR